MKQKNKANKAIKQELRTKLADALRDYLKSTNTTQKQAARYVSITPVEINKILKCNLNIGIDTLAVIDKVFELNLLNNGQEK